MPGGWCRISEFVSDMFPVFSVFFQYLFMLQRIGGTVVSNLKGFFLHFSTVFIIVFVQAKTDWKNILEKIPDNKPETNPKKTFRLETTLAAKTMVHIHDLI